VSYFHGGFSFLRPFAPPALPGFIATMTALTPENLDLAPGSLLLSHASFHTFPLQPCEPVTISSFGSACAMVVSPLARQASSFHGRLATGSHRIEFTLCLGPRFRSGLLPTPSLDDAVALRFHQFSAYRWVMTFTFWFMDSKTHRGGCTAADMTAVAVVLRPLVRLSSS